MTRDTYSVWKRGCQKISKPGMLFKNRVPSGLPLYISVCVLALGERGSLGYQEPMQRCWKPRGTQQIGLNTINTANCAIFLKATSSWLQCLFIGLFLLNITIIIFFKFVYIIKIYLSPLRIRVNNGRRKII